MLRADRDQPSSPSRAGGSNRGKITQTSMENSEQLLLFRAFLSTSQVTSETRPNIPCCSQLVSLPVNLPVSVEDVRSHWAHPPYYLLSLWCFKEARLSSASLSFFLLFSYILLNCSYYNLFNCYYCNWMLSFSCLPAKFSKCRLRPICSHLLSFLNILTV